MAVIWIEGFDDLAVTDLQPAGYVSTHPGLSMVAGRFGGQALRAGQLNSDTVVCAVPLPSQPITFGFAWKFIGGLEPSPSVAAIKSVLTGKESEVFVIRYDSTNQRIHLVARNASTGGPVTVASSVVGTVNIPVSSYSYFEISYDPVSTAAAVQLNGENILSLASGANLYGRNMGGVSLGTYMVNVYGSGEWDDLYIAEGYLAWQGEQRIITRFPTSDTSRNDLTPSAGSDNYAMVDEPTQDGDVTYNEGSTAGQMDRYASGDSTETPLTVPAIAVRSFIRKTDVETKTARNVLRTGATTAVGDTETLSTTYLGYMTTFPLNPSTGLPWTGSAVEASEFGAEIVS